MTSPSPSFKSGTPSARSFRRVSTPQGGQPHDGSPSLPQIPLPSGSGDASRTASSINLSSSFQQLSHLSQGSGLTASRPSMDRLLSEDEKARIVKKHLVSAKPSSNYDNSEASSISHAERSDFPVFDESAPESRTETNVEEGTELETETYHKLLGGDVTHDIYKYASDAAKRPIRKPRSVSFTEGASQRRGSVSSTTDPNGSRVHLGSSVEGTATGGDADHPTLDIRNIRTPGGFRRNFMLRKAAEGGESIPQQSRFTSSFIDFLSLYGHFGGEELEEIDEEDEDIQDEEETVAGFADIDADGATNGHESRPTERSPLLDRKPTLSRTLSRRRSTGGARHGDATVLQAVLMTLKGFVGTGVLFLGKAFFNGGILFSTVVLVSIALISLFSFNLLIKTRLVVPGSFGDIGGILYGNWLRIAILFSIALSQVGFVSAYLIFVAQNLQAFFLAVTNCKHYISISLLILVQLVIFLPLAMIRNIQKLSGTALIADLFILVGLVYIFGNEISVIAKHGVADVAYFNPKDFALFIGTAVFTFEGIGLIIPITESMKEPQKFPAVLSACMVFLILLFAGGGILGYAAYGSDVQTVVIVNLPQEDRFVNAVQFLYSMAIMLSTPLQLFPAVRIMENGLFSRSGKNNTRVKWQKNVFRGLVTSGCALIAAIGASDLDKFVSIVGAVACVPLCFCYPAMLHYKACAKSHWQKAADIALFLFGVFACLFCTVQTIKLLAEPSKPPKLGNCPPPSHLLGAVWWGVV